MKLLLHPGFHKTGTTWLQSQFFSRSELFHALYTHQEIDDLIARPHDLDFDTERVRLEIQSRRSRSSGNRVDVISAEDLSGYPFNGGRDSKTNADRLYSVLDDVKVLLTVRSQKEMLQSFYMQYLQRGGRRKFTEFVEYNCEPGLFWFDLDHLDYSRLTNYYASLFGAENVLVLPQEYLKRSQTDYLRHLYHFASGEDLPDDFMISSRTPVNVSAPASGIPLLRLSNIFRRAPHNPEAVGSLSGIGNLLFRAGYHFSLKDRSARQRLAAMAAAYVEGRYEQGNCELQRFCPVDLVELGYPL
ncbi:hypothetical protein [Qipengyuania mesophila]|uniref:hypothetical protein n=1 Tax=Qipengyuania mesophila TaxID=2867246 RepID=UPI003514D081